MGVLGRWATAVGAAVTTFLAVAGIVAARPGWGPFVAMVGIGGYGLTMVLFFLHLWEKDYLEQFYRPCMVFDGQLSQAYHSWTVRRITAGPPKPEAPGKWHDLAGRSRWVLAALDAEREPERMLLEFSRNVYPGYEPSSVLSDYSTMQVARQSMVDYLTAIGTRGRLWPLRPWVRRRIHKDDREHWIKMLLALEIALLEKRGEKGQLYDHPLAQIPDIIRQRPGKPPKKRLEGPKLGSGPDLLARTIAEMQAPKPLALDTEAPPRPEAEEEGPGT